jgi:hypothetical protein
MIPTLGCSDHNLAYTSFLCWSILCCSLIFHHSLW